MFSLLKDDDTMVSLGVYLPIDSPLFTYFGSSGRSNVYYAPKTGTLQITFNH
jgi:hypothetical protein